MYSGTPAPVSIRMGSRRPTRYVLVPGPVIMPGLRPRTRPTSSLGVAVFGKSGSIQGIGFSRLLQQAADVLGDRLGPGRIARPGGPPHPRADLEAARTQGRPHRDLVLNPKR